MKRPPFISVVRCVVIALGVFLFRLAYLEFFGHRGVASDIPTLARVYADAGPSYAAFSTNTFLRQMPFVGPIHWRRIVSRPFVTVSGCVDVAVFKQRMRTEPFTHISPVSSYGAPVVTFFINHRAGPWAVESIGRVNVVSGSFTMDTHELERMLDEAEWKHLTNKGYIDPGFFER